MEIEPVAPTDSATARKVFEVENSIESDDSLYFYDDAEQERLRASKPWSQDPNWFKRVRISAVALIKMVMHARSGGNIEIMGSMQGKISEKERAFIILDVFPLPVEGTETRVNAGAEANEFQVNYQSACPKVGRRENYVGWYHSHPGYGCWLSGIDVKTQTSHQNWNDPSIAIVIDPIRTMSAGKVDIGAFRTYPEDYVNNNKKTSGSAGSSSSGGGGGGGGEYQSIPIDKIEDFGVHCESYYQLEVSYFKSSLDSSLLDVLWNKYWARALSTSSLIQSNEYIVKQMKDMSRKLSQASTHICKPPVHMRRSLFMHDRRNGNAGNGNGNGNGNRSNSSNSGAMGKANAQLEAIARDADKCCGEHSQALMSMWLKRTMFNPSQ